MEGKGGRVFRNNYKGHMDKTKGQGLETREGSGFGLGGGSRGERNAHKCN